MSGKKFQEGKKMTNKAKRIFQSELNNCQSHFYYDWKTYNIKPKPVEVAYFLFKRTGVEIWNIKFDDSAFGITVFLEDGDSFSAKYLDP